MMGDEQVIRFEYQQSLSCAPGKPGWSDSLSISVRVLSEAITSGWYRDQFGKHASDFVILVGIVMHARPLSGRDLAYLISLRMAKEQDEGRLYARVTDSGLASELGLHRQTIASSANRMAEKGFIAILDIPESAVDFRDSHGHYGGSKVYLLAGDLQQRFLQKDVHHRDEKIDTVLETRVEKTGAAQATPPPKPLHRVENTTPADEKIDSNLGCRDGLFDSPEEICAINREDSEEDEEEGKTIHQRVFGHYASAKGLPQYQPTQKEREALQKLLQDGYASTEILAGIDRAFQRTNPRYFTLCARIIRELPPRSQPESIDSPARTEPEAERMEARPERAQSVGLLIETQLTKPAEILAQAGEEVSASQLVRLRLMVERCGQAARQAGAEAPDWVVDALGRGMGVARPGNLLAYADAVLDDWIANGRTRAKKSALKSGPRTAAPKGRKGIEEYIRNREGDFQKNGN